MLLNDLLFSFQGRINRQTFWLAWLCTVAVTLTAVLLVFALGTLLDYFGRPVPRFGFTPTWILLFVLIAFPFYLVTFTLGAKRLHDRGKSGWWLLLYWVFGSGLASAGYYLLEENIIGFGLAYAMIGIGNVLSLLGFVDIGCLRGTVGANVYGPDPNTAI